MEMALVYAVLRDTRTAFTWLQKAYDELAIRFLPAFAAALVHHYLRGATLGAMNEAANEMGAWVASCSGAMPEPDLAVLEKVRNAF